MFDPLSPIYSELQRLQISEFTQLTVQIRQFVTAVTRNISDLEGRTRRSKLLRMLFLVKLGSLTILR